MLDKQSVVDSRQVLEDGQIHIRVATYVVDTVTGERVMGPNYRRYVVAPDEDVSQQPAAVRRLANLEWTPAVVAAYIAAKQLRSA